MGASRGWKAAGRGGLGAAAGLHGEWQFRAAGSLCGVEGTTPADTRMWGLCVKEHKEKQSAKSPRQCMQCGGCVYYVPAAGLIASIILLGYGLVSRMAGGSGLGRWVLCCVTCSSSTAGYRLRSWQQDPGSDLN